MLCAGGRGENEVHALKDTTSWLVRAHTHTCTTAPSIIRFLLSAGRPTWRFSNTFVGVLRPQLECVCVCVCARACVRVCVRDTVCVCIIRVYVCTCLSSPSVPPPLRANVYSHQTDNFQSFSMASYTLL